MGLVRLTFEPAKNCGGGGGRHHHQQQQQHHCYQALFHLFGVGLALRFLFFTQPCLQPYFRQSHNPYHSSLLHCSNLTTLL